MSTVSTDLETFFSWTSSVKQQEVLFDQSEMLPEAPAEEAQAETS